MHKNSDASDLLPPPLVSNLASLKLQATGLHLWLLYCQLIANIFILIQFKVQGLSISNLQFSNFDSSSSQIQFESYSLLVSKVWRSQLRCSGELETIRMGWVIDLQRFSLMTRLSLSSYILITLMLTPLHIAFHCPSIDDKNILQINN